MRIPTTEVSSPLKTMPNTVRLIPANISGSFNTTGSLGCARAGPSEGISYAQGIRYLLTLEFYVNRMIIYNEYPELVGLQYYDRQDKVMMLSKCDDILRVLKEVHGDKPNVAVYPTADISYYG